MDKESFIGSPPGVNLIKLFWGRKFTHNFNYRETIMFTFSIGPAYKKVNNLTFKKFYELGSWAS
jgi:hypothetical protein